MRQLKRLFYYVLLNIFVSAVVTVVVLSWWNRTHPPIVTDSTPVVVVVTSSSKSATSQEIPLVEVGAANQNDALPSESPRPSATLELTAYKVKAGDTLGTIAQQFDLTIADLLAVNNIPDPDTLSIGQTIYIPPGPIPTVTITPLVSPTEVFTPTVTPTIQPTLGPSPTPTETPIGQKAEVTIASVIGVGDLTTERVVLERTGDGELSLAGWRLEDEDGNVYNFPQLTLYKDGAVNLHTQAGQNTVVDLYWGLANAVWRSGETVTLYDETGKVRAIFRIP
jgi:LysM repeat protein